MKNKKRLMLIVLSILIVVTFVIAVSIIMYKKNNYVNDSLESIAKLIASNAEKKLKENQTLGIDKKIKCSDVIELDNKTYGLCKITFDEEGNATVILNGSEDGKFNNMACSGTKDEITCQEGQILPGLNCTYEGELIEGAEFIHNQYTYRYRQEYTLDEDTLLGTWIDIKEDGWGITLTNKISTDPVNTPVCSYINGKPLVSTSMMFIDKIKSDTFDVISSNTTSIDVSNWDTDNVINMMGMFAYTQVTEIKGLEYLETDKVNNMSYMFEASMANVLNINNFDTGNVKDMNSMFLGSAATSLDLSNFNTSKVIDMSCMFESSLATKLDLSSFNTINVTDMNSMFADSVATSLDLSSFDTSNVINMNSMFYGSAVTILDLSSFDTSKVTDMNSMFFGISAKNGYARNKDEVAKFNNTIITGIPSTLTFTLK